MILYIYIIFLDLGFRPILILILILHAISNQMLLTQEPGI